MARPRKRGLDYFPFDTDFFSDNKIRILRARFGVDGIAVYIFILCEIYREGYYLTWNEDTEFIVADELGMSHEKVRQVMTFLFGRSLLKKMSTLPTPDTVITSAGIQRRYQLAVRERASKTPIEVDARIWLLDDSETKPWLKVIDFEGYSEKNKSFSERNAEETGEKVHKVKESKVKESIVNTGGIEPPPFLSDFDSIDPLSSIISLYAKEIDPVPSTSVLALLDVLHKKGMQPEVMRYAINSAADNNKRNWAYVRAILRNLDKEGVLSVEALNERERKFQEQKSREKGYRSDRDNRGNFSTGDDYEYDNGEFAGIAKLRVEGQT